MLYGGTLLHLVKSLYCCGYSHKVCPERTRYETVGFEDFHYLTITTYARYRYPVTHRLTQTGQVGLYLPIVLCRQLSRPEARYVLIEYQYHVIG